MHKPVAVGNKILSFARESPDWSVTPMQLLKLAYLCHGWMLGLYGRPLLNESVQAWRYGPVVRSLYDAISKYRDKPVEHPIRPFWGVATDDEQFDAEESEVIRQVYNHYGRWDGIALSKLTHMAGSPWYVTWHSKGQNAVIPNDLIENFYRKRHEQLAKGSAPEQR